MRLRERAAGLLDSSTEVGRAALDLYCWAHPPLDLVVAAAGFGLVVGLLVGAGLVWTFSHADRRPS